MKKISTAIFYLASVSLSCGGQSETPKETHQKFFEQFTLHFNNSQWDRIAENASVEFLQAVPKPKLTQFLSGLRNDLGRILESRPYSFDEKEFAVYHVKLEKAWLKFRFALDKQNKLAALLVVDPNYNELLPAKKNESTMTLPFDGEWFTFWGGDEEQLNYHVSNQSQRNAFDFVIRDTANRSFKSTGEKNEDYYAFGQRIYSPCNGEVVAVTEGVPDNIPGKMNPAQLTGNSVTIRTDKNEYVLMAHFKLGSIAVKKGQQVKTSEFIGLCGNSGNSSEPHLHFHIMDKPEMKDATGIKCFFDSLKVNGVVKKNYSPVRGDRVANE